MELDARRMNTALHHRCRAVFMRGASSSIRCSREKNHIPLTSHTFPFLKAIVHDCHNPGETCLIRAHTLRDLDQRCEVVDERRGTGKSPDCFELFKTVVENCRSRHSGVEA